MNGKGGLREKIRRSWFLKRVILPSVLIFLPLALYLWQQNEIIGYGYRIEELRKEKERLLELKRKLLVERSKLEIPERIERKARKGLSLIPTPAERIYLLEYGNGQKGEALTFQFEP